MITSYKNVTTQPIVSDMKSSAKNLYFRRLCFFHTHTHTHTHTAEILQHTVTCVTFSISHILFGNASTYEGHVLGTVGLLLLFVAHTVVCRIARFWGQCAADCPASW